MHLVQSNAPIPDLRIVATDRLHPHEEHDYQRSEPLIENMRSAEFLMNPPIVAPIGDDEYVILDGANRCFVFSHLGYPHILAQVVTYDSGFVALDVWHHIISRWTVDALLDQVAQIDGVLLKEIPLHSGKIVSDEKHSSKIVSAGGSGAALAEIRLRDDRCYGIFAEAETLSARNAVLRQVVKVYQTQAVLDRTAISEPHQILPLYPESVALMVFPQYTPQDIMMAAKEGAYLPPGVSRHIIQGRAVRVNFPIEVLRDANGALDDKNEGLQAWIQQKFSKRQVRYYAEATYQFDE